LIAQTLSDGKYRWLSSAGGCNRNILLAPLQLHNSAKIKPNLQSTVREKDTFGKQFPSAESFRLSCAGVSINPHRDASQTSRQCTVPGSRAIASEFKAL